MVLPVFPEMKWKVVKNRYFKSSSQANSTNTGTASVDFSKTHPFLQHHFVFFVSHGKSVPGLKKKVNNTVVRENVFFHFQCWKKPGFGKHRNGSVIRTSLCENLLKEKRLREL